MHACTHARMHACTHAHMHTCTHAHMHTCTHAHMHTCTHAHMHTCTHAHMRTLLHISPGNPARQAQTPPAYTCTHKHKIEPIRKQEKSAIAHTHTRTHTCCLHRCPVPSRAPPSYPPSYTNINQHKYTYTSRTSMYEEHTSQITPAVFIAVQCHHAPSLYSASGP